MKAMAMIFVGWLFAIGLGISGMTDVDAVIGFLNVLGDWDPSLLGVMGGAIVVYAVTLPLIQRMQTAPMHGAKFHIPTRRDIDGRLLLGAALFGAGWGIAGVCPGPGLTSMVSGAQTSVVFVASMIVGMFAYQRFFTPGWSRPTPQLAD